MVGWHHQLNGHEFEHAPGNGEGQGSLECCISWGRKELDMTEQLNNNNPWPVARLQETALPASSPALTRGPGFTCQRVGSSSKVFQDPDSA